MPSVCGGSRFARLRDGQGFMAKFQIFIPLMDFITYFFTMSEENHLDLCKKLSFDKNLAKRPKSSDFETISGFCSSLIVELISNFQIFKFNWTFSLE